jgi:DNA mismatch repair protein MSH2
MSLGPGGWERECREGKSVVEGVRWRGGRLQCEGKELSREEMVGKMREMVKGDEKLAANPFFQSVKAL